VVLGTRRDSSDVSREKEGKIVNGGSGGEVILSS